MDLAKFIQHHHLQNDPHGQLFYQQTLELTTQLQHHIHMAIGPLSSKLLNFVSIVRNDSRLACDVIDFFRVYYGRSHPRLAVKLFLTALQLNQARDQPLRIKLLEEALKIAQLIIPTMTQLRSNGRNRHHHLHQLNHSFLGEVERILYSTKNQVHVERAIANNSQRNRCRSSSLFGRTFSNPPTSTIVLPSLTVSRRDHKSISLLRQSRPLVSKLFC